VHFCWLGGQIKPAAAENVRQWAMQAENSNWKIYVWTTRQTNWGSAFTPFIGKLSRGNIERKYIEQGGLDDRLKAHFHAAVEAKDYPAASDLARYGILYKYGGVYADVDLGIGRVQLHTDIPRLSRNDFPILGPQLRDKRSRDDALLEADFTAEKLQALGLSEGEKTSLAAEHYISKGRYGNHFFAAQRGSTAMNRIIGKVASANEGVTVHDFGTGDAAIRTGPNPMFQALVDFQRERTGGDYDPSGFQPEGARRIHEKLQWLTDESENQDYAH
jgi:hypothetical protein